MRRPPRWLRSADPSHAVAERATTCGPGLVVIGPPIVTNDGAMHLGANVRIESGGATTHLVVGDAGVMRIGDDVTIGTGCALSCVIRIEIGSGAALAPFVAVMDSDFHVAGDHANDAPPLPIVIGPRARIGASVVILRGSTIGADAVVAAGSVVTGLVPAGAHVAGNPAIPLGHVSGGAEVDVVAIVQRTFGLATRPPFDFGPDDIEGWDSLGALRLLLAIEQALGTPLDERALAGARSVGEIKELVASNHRTGPATGSP